MVPEAPPAPRPVVAVTDVPLIPPMPSHRGPQQREVMVCDMGGGVDFRGYVGPSGHPLGVQAHACPQGRPLRHHPRFVGRQHNSNQTVRLMYYIPPHLPTQRCWVIFRSLRWLQHHAYWSGDNTVARHSHTTSAQKACRGHGARVGPLWTTTGVTCAPRDTTAQTLCVCEQVGTHVSKAKEFFDLIGCYLCSSIAPPFDPDPHECLSSPACPPPGFLCRPKARRYQPMALGFRNDGIGLYLGSIRGYVSRT